MNMLRRHLTALVVGAPLVLLALLFVIFQSTDPATVRPSGILGIFILIYLACLSTLFVLLRFGLYWGKRLLSRRGPLGLVKTGRLSEKKAYYIASVFAFIPVTLLAMHAFSSLQWLDVVLVFGLVSLATFYIVKRY